ncbi:MAG: lipopolysaccharide biosynthesis protein, partial [Deltaproteobacteria bacterium]|nr:lipopolysaccharide biosynthesis protein [Deltaproteobacteria bacterium]
MAMEQAIDIKYVKGIIRRRKTSFILIFLLVFLLISCVAMVLPPSYISKSTILIENQLIPQEYVRTTITGFVEERLQIIKQQIMSRTRLMEIINRFKLYGEMRARYTTAEIVEKMRDDIKLNTISADVRDKRTGLSTAATIAFTLSYEGKNPDTVQKVANVLASLYLEENLRTREQRASNTTEFLEQELNQLKKQINDYQMKISAFKQAHLGELPEHNAVNMTAINRLERDLNAVSMQINALEERKILLEGQMSQLTPLLEADTASGEEDRTSRERLKILRLELINLKARVSEKHPDVIRLKKEIAELENRVGKIDDAEEKTARLKDINAQLAELSGKFGPNHPDVKRLKKEAVVLADEIEKMRSEHGSAVFEEEKQENPAAINLKNQLALTQLQIDKHREEKAIMKGEILRYQK